MRINYQQTIDLLEAFGGESAVMIVTELEDGNDGPGLYAHLEDYPAEGSIFLGDADSDKTEV